MPIRAAGAEEITDPRLEIHPDAREFVTVISNVKIGGPGTAIDVPLAHKDNIWSFDHLATMTISTDDAPRPDEIVVIMAISDGGRPHPRVGKGRV